MYLNYNLVQDKDSNRENNARQLQLVRKEITSHADNRFFNLTHLRQARFRFQPHALHYAGSLRRGALE